MHKSKIIVSGFFLSFFLFSAAILKAENTPKKEELVIMTIGDRSIPLEEFKYIAKKNGLVNFKDKEAVNNYIDLFVNFKRKVFEAEALGMDKTPEFIKELKGYESQARSSLLRDEESERKVVQQEYDRYLELVEVEQILVKLPGLTLAGDTVDAYKKAMEIYEGLEKNKNFLDYGKEVSKEEGIVSAYLGYVRPLEALKAFENKIYGAEKGSIIPPFRTALGYHIVHVIDRKPLPDRLKVAHILLPINKEIEGDEKHQFERADSIYNALENGADFAELANKYSTAKSGGNGGELPPFGIGDSVKEFEDVVYSMTPGDISRPFKTPFGIHIAKLLGFVGKPSFQDVRPKYYSIMESGEWNFEIYGGWDEYLKKEYNYIFHKEAFDELVDLAKEYFPTDTAFINRGIEKDKVLFELDSKEILQSDFAYYVQDCPFSTKPYAEDFLTDVYNLFVRELGNQFERKNFDKKHPDFEYLISEYRDGMLLFAISSQEVWDKASRDEAILKDYYEKNKANYSDSFEQDRTKVVTDYQNYLEKEWENKLQKKYPLKINKKVLKQL